MAKPEKTPIASPEPLTGEDLVIFAKWTAERMYTHRLYVMPSDQIAYYMLNRESIKNFVATLKY